MTQISHYKHEVKITFIHVSLMLLLLYYSYTASKIYCCAGLWCDKQRMKCTEWWNVLEFKIYGWIIIINTIKPYDFFRQIEYSGTVKVCTQGNLSCMQRNMLYLKFSVKKKNLMYTIWRMDYSVFHILDIYKNITTSVKLNC